ncbi:MAG: hypothetical protein ACI92G_003010 [Candidatus Pelagisphaera sp.]|jgi:hypothetical protein
MERAFFAHAKVREMPRFATEVILGNGRAGWGLGTLAWASGDSLDFELRL